MDYFVFQFSPHELCCVAYKIQSEEYTILLEENLFMWLLENQTGYLTDLPSKPVCVTHSNFIAGSTNWDSCIAISKKCLVPSTFPILGHLSQQAMNWTMKSRYNLGEGPLGPSWQVYKSRQSREQPNVLLYLWRLIHY